MKIAIVKLSALGDIVHAMVALQFIKAKYPEAQIDWVVEQGFAGLLENNPHIERILTVNLKALKNQKSAFFSEISKIRSYAHHQYDIVIDAQGLIKSAITAKLLGGQLFGFDKNSIREKPASYFYDTGISFPYNANTIDRNVGVISQALGFQVSEQEIIDKQAFLFSKAVDESIASFFNQSKKNVLLVIGSTWESRNYPKQKFLEIAEQLQQNCLVVWGNEQEQIKAQWLSEQSHNICCLPKLDLNQLKAVIAQADLVIGNDTGPTHMAWGLNRPSITLFGPTPVSRVYQTPINHVFKSASTVNPFKLNKQDFSIRELSSNAIAAKSLQLLDLT